MLSETELIELYGPEQLAEWRRNMRRDEIDHGWDQIEYLAGRDPHFEPPTSSVEREGILKNAIESLMVGSYAR